MKESSPPLNEYGPACKLSGTICNLKVTRDSASFFFTRDDQMKMGVVAIAAAMAGLGGPAIASASNASAVDEEADYLEFNLNGQLVKGWVWRNPPFKNGDVVDVAAQFVGDHWEAYGIARPSDRMVALYPHCSRGRLRHYRSAFKSWLLFGGGFLALVCAPLGYFLLGNKIIEDWDVFAWLMLFFGIMTFSISRRWLPFVRVAEKVFSILEFDSPSSIDLVKSSVAKRSPGDSREFGIFYFRY